MDSQPEKKAEESSAKLQPHVDIHAAHQAPFQIQSEIKTVIEAGEETIILRLLKRWSRPKGQLPFSWILPNQLAIGPAPQSPQHWSRLSEAGFQSRFSCCYLEEERLLPPGNLNLAMARVGLPDHRNQEPLLPSRLVEAIQVSRGLMDQSPPLYLHCWAGQQRSALLAIAHVCMLRRMSVFKAMVAVREAHPPSNPLYDHLELLENLLRDGTLLTGSPSEPTLHSSESFLQT